MQPDTLATMPSDTKVNAFWDALKERTGARNFDHWFHHKTTLEVSADELTIGVASPFLMSWMQKQFHQTVTAVAGRVFGESIRVNFAVDERAANIDDGSETGDNSHKDKGTSAKETAGQRRKKKGPNVSRDTRRFADLAEFVEGSCNALALTASRHVCEAPGSRCNPLFLYGNVGTGKSHLLEGIYRQIRQSYPSLQVLFLTAESFANYFTQALREHTLPSFRQKFRNVDVLLVDDIDFLDSKRVIQEEFLHTFQGLEQFGRQVVVSADRHPRLLSKLSEELSSRFLSGLVCRLESPDFETRRQIVSQKAAQLDAEISPEAITFIAQRFKNNVRELHGALNCLDTYYCMNRKRIGVTVAREVLASLERDCVKLVRMSDIEQAICNFFGVGASDLKSSRRQRSLSQPRMLAMFLARKHTQAAYSEIGEYFGGRNHSTVMSAEKKVKSWIADRTPIRVASQTWQFDELLDALEHKLQAS